MNYISPGAVGLGLALLMQSVPAVALTAAVVPRSDTMAAQQAAMRLQIGDAFRGSVHISTVRKSSGESLPACTGTMLNAFVMLTAAHCFEHIAANPGPTSTHRRSVDGLAVEFTSGTTYDYKVISGATNLYGNVGATPGPGAEGFGTIESFVRLNFRHSGDLALAYVQPGVLPSGVEGAFRPTVATLDDRTRLFLSIDPNAHAGVKNKIVAYTMGYNAADPIDGKQLGGQRREGVFTFLDPGLHANSDASYAKWRSQDSAVYSAAANPVTDTPPGEPPIYNNSWQLGAGFPLVGDSGGALISLDIHNRPVLIGVTSFVIPTLGNGGSNQYWSPVGPHHEFVTQALDTLGFMAFVVPGLAPTRPLFANSSTDDGVLLNSSFSVDDSLSFAYFASHASDVHRLSVEKKLMWGLEFPDGVPATFLGIMTVDASGAYVELTYQVEQGTNFLLFDHAVSNLELLGPLGGDAVGTLTLGLGLSDVGASRSALRTLDGAADTVRLTWVSSLPPLTPVPEPAAALLWLAALPLVWRRLRRPAR